MENKNKNNINSSNSLVFGRWPQTKTNCQRRDSNPQPRVSSVVAILGSPGFQKSVIFSRVSIGRVCFCFCYQFCLQILYLANANEILSFIPVLRTLVTLQDLTGKSNLGLRLRYPVVRVDVTVSKAQLLTPLNFGSAYQVIFGCFIGVFLHSYIGSAELAHKHRCLQGSEGFSVKE